MPHTPLPITNRLFRRLLLAIEQAPMDRAGKERLTHFTVLVTFGLPMLLAYDVSNLMAGDLLLAALIFVASTSLVIPSMPVIMISGTAAPPATGPEETEQPSAYLQKPYGLSTGASTWACTDDMIELSGAVHQTLRPLGEALQSSFRCRPESRMFC